MKESDDAHTPIHGGMGELNFGKPGKMDPTGMMSDESYIRGTASDNPEGQRLMKKYGLKEDPKHPGVYGSQGRNFK